MMRTIALVGVWWITGPLLFVSAEGMRSSKHRVPDGFVIEQVAGEPDVVFPMFAAFDDRGRLFVAESSGLDLYAEISAGTRKCRIRLLEDRDGDGRFETARVFADRLVFPMGLVWREGRLYVADPPDLVALEDTNGDGRADQRTVLLSGFGHKDNGSLHGLVFGPDGLLYMTMGSPDGYELTRQDGTVLRGESGALLRCRPDGSRPEVLCRGFENLVEVVFTPRGEVLGTDNWFQRPTGGIRDALVHLVEGGLYPYHRDVGTPLPVTGEPLPAVSLFPAVALSGLARYRGTAFPGEMHGNLFSAQHNARRVGRHVLVPDGSTFRSLDFDFVTTDDPDFHPSDVLEAADGSLLVVDTGSWYVHHCPTGQIRKTRAPGGIYRVRPAHGPAVADPWGLQVDWPALSERQLVQLLGDRRPMVRDRAQRTLSSRGRSAVAPLAAALGGPGYRTAKQHAIWSLAAIADGAALVPLRRALHDADPDVVTPAARVLGLRQDRASAPDLCRLLTSEAPPVRLAAAEALTHCGDARSLPALWQALAGQPDRFLEHALVHALHRLAEVHTVAVALDHPHTRVQKAALWLLDQAPRPAGQLTHGPVLSRVTAGDPDLRQAALRILLKHPEWAEPALALVRGWLEKPSLTPEEQLGLRSLLVAFQARRAVQESVADALANRSGQTPADRRRFLLETLSQCTLPQLPKAWVEALRQALEEPAPEIRLQAARTLAVLQLSELDEPLAQLAEDGRQPLELRLEALRAVVPRRPQLSAAAFELLLGQLGDQVSPTARLAAAEMLGQSRPGATQLARLLQAIRGEVLISPSVLLPALRRSVTAATAPAVLDYLAEALRLGWKPAEHELDQMLEALPEEVRAGTASLRELWRQSGERQRARLAEFEPLLSGGRAERGRAVFFGPKVACASCHAIGSEGGHVGPDLTRIGTVRSGRDLLEAIVVPSSTLVPGYETYFVATADGRVANGLIARQAADTLVLRDSSGAEVRLRKDQIQEMRRLATSVMPENLQVALTRDELRDLLAFLQGLK
jgi:putative heme-binding domain-containing protein